MRKVKIAQIGISTYNHGKDIFNTLKRNSDVFEIVGYALPENEREKFPERMIDFEGYQEMTVEEILNNPEIEAVTVETEEIYLTKYASLAAAHKKHIHMEKPGGVELPAFEKLIESVKTSGTVFHTGYMYRYNPYVIDLKEQIKRGELGKIVSVEAQMSCIHNPQMRQWLEAFPGGIMFYLGCHLVDFILQIQGKPENIIPLSRSTGHLGVTADDFGMAVFEYQNGVSFAKVNATELGGFARRQLVVTGTKKTVELKPLECYEPSGMFTGKVEYTSRDWGDAGNAERCASFNRYDKMMTTFASMVRGETENPYSYDYELELYKNVLKACGRSDV